jgi:ubiquinone/menaquinone biosynthesis C-methylase UbiE
MTQDFDNTIGFWIKGIPYIWSADNVIENCKRYYILDSNLSVALFDEHNKIVDPRKKPSEKSVMSLFPFENKKCALVRNCFLIDLQFNSQKAAELVSSGFDNLVRVEGKSLLPGNKINTSHSNAIFDIVDPKTNYQQRLFGYTSIFGDPKYLSPFDIEIPILLKTKDGKIRKFRNIEEASKIMKFDKKDLKRVHLEALSQSYLEFKSNLRPEVGQLTIDIIKDVNPSYEIRSAKDFGWRYTSLNSIMDAHILYLMVVKEKRTPQKDVNKKQVWIPTHKNQKGNPMQSSCTILKPTYRPREIVYTKDCLSIAQKITRDKNPNVKEILEKFYKKKVGQPIWSTNKTANANHYAWFLKYCKTKNPVYVDIGCGSGNDTVLISKELDASKTLCVDVEDSRVNEAKSLNFMLIKKEIPLVVDTATVDIVTLFHTLHHMEDATSRLKDINRILKKDGLLVIKDHDTETELDAENVTFEHFVYSIGEGEANVNDEKTYKDILPMYYYSANSVVNFLESCGFKKLYCNTYKNPTRTYNAVFQKV